MQDYLDFLASKRKKLDNAGFQVSPDRIRSHLFPNQSHIVRQALRKARYAIFSAPGTGKTLMQLEWASHVSSHTGRQVLILCPLAVSGQTILEGGKFGIEVHRYAPDSQAPILITNYEQIENIDPGAFAGIVLDESSILKNYEGRTKEKILEAFADTPFKLACTATPSPNDPMELGNHAEFLGIMSRNEMLAMYFVHDGGNTSQWRLKGHCVQIFYDWCAQWSVMFTRPSDIGFPDDDRYNLPPLHLHEEQIVTPKRDNGLLFNDANVNATDFNAELRNTREARLQKVVDIVQAHPAEPFIIWIRQNEEGEALRALLPDAVEVKGSDSPDWKEEKLIGFARSEFRILITKPKIAQFGLNYQHCRHQVFAALDFSFEGLYQSIRRSWRFGQTDPVHIHLITTDTMQNVVHAIRDKQKQFEDMQKSMTNAVNGNFDTSENQEASGETFKTQSATLHLGDCVQLIRDIPDDSIGFSIFSPPFAELYTYSDQVADMGNSKDYREFMYAFSFLVRDLYRVLWSGRNVAVHCMDLPIQKGKEGFIGLRDFSGLILRAFEDAGFVYHSRVTIWKDPVVEMQRTKALGLLHKQIKKDAAMSRVGIPDYLLVFRKPGPHNHPVRHQDANPAAPDYLPVNLWQKYASPIWYDINYSDTLNAREGRDQRDEKHICPLQLPTIERALHLWTNEGDTVLSPFAGIGSELYQAIRMDRRAIGFELKHSYFEAAKRNLQAAEQGKSQLSMLNLIEEPA